MSSDEANRIRAVYARREAAGAEDKYAYWNPANLFLIQQLEKSIVKAFARHNLLPLTDRRVLDIGCGDGFWLRFFLRLGADPQNLSGIDLIDGRIEQARLLAANIDFRTGDATALPYADGSFDVVSQFTVFTSILNATIKRQIASEMLRVLRQDGVVLWYDFVINPKNRDTKGIAQGEIRSLFPACNYDFTRVTLAPPLTRLLARQSSVACAVLESIPLFRTHTLALITKKGAA